MSGNNIDVFYDSLKPSQQRSLRRWLNTGNEHRHIMQIKEELQLLLFNKRNIVTGKSKIKCDPIDTVNTINA